MHRKHLPIWAIIILDILAAGAALCVFALFHHVLPMADRSGKRAHINNPYVTEAPVTTEDPGHDLTATADVTDRLPVYEWTDKFREYFTPEVILTDHSYSGPTLAISYAEYNEPIDGENVRYYVVDIHMASINCFRTLLAEDTYGSGVVEDLENMAVRCGAVVAATGDYYGYRKSGLVVRNGDVYRTTLNTLDIGTLYYDGTLATYRTGEYSASDIIKGYPYQSWCFGPGLLDGESRPFESFHSSYKAVSDSRNPRSGLGFIEPGHYIYIVAEGRSSYSAGVTLPQFARMFSDRGCVSAYNMDGGGSAAFTFNGEIVNRRSNGDRKLSDCIYFAEADHE